MKKQAMKKKMSGKKMGSCAGNTDYSVNRKSKTGSQNLKEDVLDGFNQSFPSTESTYKEIPGTANSQVKEIPVTSGRGRVRKGF